MSTDYKIGIVVGLVVLIAGIVYFLMSGQEQPPVPPVEVQQQPAGPNLPVVTPQETPTETASETVTTMEEVPLDATNTVAPATQPAAATETTQTEGWEFNKEQDTTAAVETEETPSQPQPVSTLKVAVAQDDAADGFELDPEAEQDWNKPDLKPVIRTIQAPDETDTADQVGTAGGTYVVKKGDNGFWIIAQRVYGPDKGKYWKLIRDANPTADTNALREGQMLKIPALPAEATQTAQTVAPVVREEFGLATTDAAGNRTYIVAEGEAGLWGVAKKVYDGKGHLWEHIQRANPGVNPTALKPGMKLIIPPLPTTTPTRTSGTTGTARTARTSGRNRGEVFTENGRRYYIVQAGDKGYWGIAKKVYKDGKYSYLIDRANTGVDSYSLQPGDKLEVPPIPAGAATAAPRRRTIRPTRPASAPRSDEPDFGP